jgi:hypothetical protein
LIDRNHSRRVLSPHSSHSFARPPYPTSPHLNPPQPPHPTTPSPPPPPPPLLAPPALPGWKRSTRGIKTFSALPAAAKAYVKRIEAVVGVPIAWIGTGAGRDDMITKGFTLKPKAA